MDVVLLHNQKAGEGDRSSHDVADLLRRHGYRPEAISLKDAFAGTDPLDRGEFIVVAGGDGSVRQVATRLAHRNRALALLPMGTANNIATSLCVTGDLDAIVAGWKDGIERRIDLGCVKGPWGSRFFIEGVGIGLIGRAIHILDGIDDACQREFSSRKDKLYRDLCILYTLASEMPPVPVSVEWTGRDRVGEHLLLEILNISRAGPGFELAKHADPSDGQLDVVSVRPEERGKLQESVLRCLADLDHGTILQAERAQELRLEIRAGQLRVDDDILWPPKDQDVPAEALPPAEVEISIEPGAVQLLLPASCARGR